MHKPVARDLIQNASPIVADGLVAVGYSPPEGAGDGQGGFALLDAGTGQIVKVTPVSQKEIKIELSARNVKGCAEARRLREEGQPVGADFDCPRLATAIRFALTMKKAQTY